MEDKEEIIGEEHPAPSSEETKTTFTFEEVEAMKKKMQSDSEKWVQKLINEKKTYEIVLGEIYKVANNREYLIELYEDNQDVAKIILDKYYKWMSISQFKTEIWYEEDYTNPKVIEKEVTKRAQALEESRLIEKSKKDFVSKLKMTPEETEKFEEAFEERKQLKSFSVDNLEKNLERAYREVSDNPEQLKAMKDAEIIANTIATWEGKGWNSGDWKKSSLDLAREDANEFLKNFNI